MRRLGDAPAQAVKRQGHANLAAAVATVEARLTESILSGGRFFCRRWLSLFDVSVEL